MEPTMDYIDKLSDFKGNSENHLANAFIGLKAKILGI